MKVVRFFPAAGLLIVCTVLLCLPGSSLPSNWFFSRIPQFDKLVHITLFFLLCAFFSYPLKHSNLETNKRRKWLVIITLAVISYGIAMEFVQKYWIPNRSFEVYDILADTAGSLLAFWWGWKRFLHKPV